MKELKTGINGKGNTVWQVVVYKDEGKTVIDFIHTFETKEEAECWMKWA